MTTITSVKQSASSAALRMMRAWSLDIRRHRSAIFKIYLITLEDFFNYNCVGSIPKMPLHVLKTYKYMTFQCKLKFWFFFYASCWIHCHSKLHLLSQLDPRLFSFSFSLTFVVIIIMPNTDINGFQQGENTHGKFHADREKNKLIYKQSTIKSHALMVSSVGIQTLLCSHALSKGCLSPTGTCS